MKLRDRLLKNRISGDNTGIAAGRTKNEFSISDIFADSREIRKYIADLAQQKRNMLLISSKSFDKFIIADYFKSQLIKTNARIIDDIDSRTDDLNGRVNIVPNPNIHNIVKILEQIIYGCQSFIIGTNLGSYDNIINKLQVLIALNYKNLTPLNITTLIGAMKPIVVYISKNADGLFFISQVDEIKLNDTASDLEITTLFTNDKLSKKTQIKKEEIVIKEEAISKTPDVKEEIEEKQEVQTTKAETPPVEIETGMFEEVTQLPEKPNIPEEKISLQYKLDEARYETNTKEKTLNKYQMLKEKAKQRKIEAQTDIDKKV